ncbi:MAG: ABC transporter permease [Rhodovulum sp.]|jgi:NitT/TauT family transport system permease protein|nr:ABC transporter permease [Rhodovulum sp.]
MTDKFTAVLYPLLTFVVLVAVWKLSIVVFDVPDYILPEPLAVLRSLEAGYLGGEFWPHFLFTLRSTVTGYVLGCVLAIVIGTLLAESRLFEKCFYPYIVAMQSMPKVALAPLIVVWFGYGVLSKVVMVALMCFFPLFVNTVVGIRQADPALLNMMRAFSAPSWLIFYRVKLFAAAGHIFAGLQISIVLSLIGAVVAEFVASSSGIGWLIQSSLANFNTAQMFAALFSLVFIGLVGTKLVQFFHRRLVFWDKAGPNTIASE